MSAGRNATGSDNVFLGYAAGSDETGSNKLYIENSSSASPLIWGDFANNRVAINGTTGAYTNTFVVNGSALKTSGGSTWAVPSDRRLKDIHGDFSRGLEAIEQLQPIVYRYKADNALNLPPDKEQVGLVAQEVREVLPEAVTEDENGYLAVNSDPIIWTMLNAIKELKTEINGLKAENEMVKAENAALRQQLQADNVALREELDRLKERLQPARPAALGQ